MTKYNRAYYIDENGLQQLIQTEDMVYCNIPCHKPWMRGCKRINKINPEIDENINCIYYGM